MRSNFRILVVSTLLLASATFAQTPKYLYSPAGSHNQGGGGGFSNIPWHGRSGTVQQIHDYVEMAGVSGGKPAPVTMKALGFRPAGKAQWLSRSLEVRLTVGHSPNSAAKASLTFSNNLVNSRVVYGTSSTFAKLSVKAVTGTGDPNPIALTVPFASTYVYLPVQNRHFCWEWRHQNASITTAMPTDACSGVYGTGTVLPHVGSGCSAWSDANVSWQGEYHFRNTLSGAPRNTKSLALIGLTKQRTNLAGWCANLELVPLVHVPGSTNGAGSWVTFNTPISVFRGLPQFHIYIQYAFLDSRRAFGVGLSNASAYRTNLPGGWNMSRVVKSTANYNLNDHATATTGAWVDTGQSLVVGFLQ